MGTIAKFAPAIAAFSYAVYVIFSGQTAQIPTALTGILAAFGYHSAQSAHAKIEQL